MEVVGKHVGVKALVKGHQTVRVGVGSREYVGRQHHIRYIKQSITGYKHGWVIIINLDIAINIKYGKTGIYKHSE